MSAFELLVCERCGHEHVRESGSRRFVLRCHYCHGPHVAYALVRGERLQTVQTGYGCVQVVHAERSGERVA